MNIIIHDHEVPIDFIREHLNDLLPCNYMQFVRYLCENLWEEQSIFDIFESERSSAPKFSVFYTDDEHLPADLQKFVCCHNYKFETLHDVETTNMYLKPYLTELSYNLIEWLAEAHKTSIPGLRERLEERMHAYADTHIFPDYATSYIFEEDDLERVRSRYVNSRFALGTIAPSSLEIIFNNVSFLRGLTPEPLF